MLQPPPVALPPLLPYCQPNPAATAIIAHWTAHPRTSVTCSPGRLLSCTAVAPPDETDTLAISIRPTTPPRQRWLVQEDICPEVLPQNVQKQAKSFDSFENVQNIQNVTSEVFPDAAKPQELCRSSHGGCCCSTWLCDRRRGRCRGHCRTRR